MLKNILVSLAVVGFITAFTAVPFNMLTSEPSMADYIALGGLTTFNICGGLMMLREIWK